MKKSQNDKLTILQIEGVFDLKKDNTAVINYKMFQFTLNFLLRKADF